uniref:Uncharacterized protein n=1 Tax=Klebsiella pneumoniae TaxID=573 RepID=A0A8B0SS55_KLEPN|nr:hypothetical protein [Klebsiella pneumoniae]
MIVAEKKKMAKEELYDAAVKAAIKIRLRVNHKEPLFSILPLYNLVFRSIHQHRPTVPVNPEPGPVP